VAWEIPPSAAADHPAVRAATAPLIEAGFRILSAISPPEALARLARQRPREVGRRGAAWLSLNRHAVAIAIVDGGELVFSRVFDWNYHAAQTVREELLQRYLLVAHLAPELRRGIDVVRLERGVNVDAIVTCGDLPDLRSLTMPLIEELDIEVETLDSLDGLDVMAPATTGAIGEKAPALRLACAAAGDSVLTGSQTSSRTAVIAAVATIVAATATWGAWRMIREPDPAPAQVVRTERAITPQPTVQSEAPQERPRSTQVNAPETTTPRPMPDPNVPAATMGVQTPALSQSTETRPPAARPGRPSARQTTSRLTGGIELAPARSAANQRRAAALTAPLPIVNSILVSPDRRVAVVDGAIVREGEPVGPRVLQRIERDGIVLREPSGHEVRVPIRRRVGS
jgi:hypothetical protein